MAFGGNAGPAANLLRLGDDPSGGVVEVFVLASLAYDAGSRVVYRSLGTTQQFGGGQELIRSFRLAFNDNGSPATPVLSAFIGGLSDGSTSDTGILVTGVPAAFQHGLPANFGPGRGNWTESDLPRLSINRNSQTAIFAATTNGVFVIALILLAGDLTIVFKNTSTEDIAALELIMRYDHSSVF